jgi:hypothetical protein
MATVNREELTCDVEGCGKVCKGPAALGAHKRYAHKVRKSPPLTDRAAPAEEVGATSSVTFRSPRNPELRVVITRTDRMLIPTPAGTIQELRQGKTAEFREGLFTTDDPEIINYLENRYHDARYPILSQRVISRMGHAR